MDNKTIINTDSIAPCHLPSDFTLDQYGLHVRLVCEEDAAFIVRLRTDERLGRYLHSTANDVEKQREWIREYKKREEEGTEYYFIFETASGNPLGVYRLYNISEQSFTTGSWIFIPEAPMGAAMIAFIIAREVVWKIVPDAVNLYDTKKGNTSVLQFTSTFAPKVIRETEDMYYFENLREDFETHKGSVLRMLADRMAKMCEIYDRKIAK